jgi:intracellular multiplication protein IcmL
VTKCLALTPGMGALRADSLIHDAYVWMNPIEPRYFFVDGKNRPRPAVTLDSPIVDDTELLEWTVKAVLAPYNVDYFNYPVELDAAPPRGSGNGRQFRSPPSDSWDAAACHGTATNMP